MAASLDDNAGSGIAILTDNKTLHQLQYKLDKRCTKNNEAEKLAILKALEKIEAMKEIEHPKTVAIYTDSRVTLDSLKIPKNHNYVIEHIR